MTFVLFRGWLLLGHFFFNLNLDCQRLLVATCCGAKPEHCSRSTVVVLHGRLPLTDSCRYFSMAVPVTMTRPFEAGGKGLMPTESRSPHPPPHLPPIAHGAIQSECKIMLGSPRTGPPEWRARQTSNVPAESKRQ
ncbi:hypothetical protein CI102_2683 [Trichoderma harzianum]|nr:hypothetical protein CI102_2683 [Trichoderma harzianum]